jgi:hypothetical protein
MYARTGRSVVYRAFEDDAAFAEEAAGALEFYRARVRHGLVHNSRSTGNPVGYIVENKAAEPSRYIERQAILNLSVSTTISDQDALPLLRAMLADLTPTSQAALMPAPTETP